MKKIGLFLVLTLFSAAVSAQAESDKPASRISIESKSASGSSQTTVIDVNGNLRVVTKEVPSITPAPNPSLATNDTATPVPATVPMQPTATQP